MSNLCNCYADEGQEPHTIWCASVAHLNLSQAQIDKHFLFLLGEIGPCAAGLYRGRIDKQIEKVLKAYEKAFDLVG